MPLEPGADSPIRWIEHAKGDLPGTVQKEAVTITRRDRPVAVVVSPDRYAELEAMEDAFWAARAKCAADRGFAGVEDTAAFMQEMLPAAKRRASDL